MFYRLDGALPPKTLGLINDALEDAEWVSGGVTAHGAAKAAKDNLQLAPTSELAHKISKLVLDSLRSRREFVWATRAKAFGPVLVARYDKGMAYGTHLDAPVMRSPAPVRIDISFTVFLNHDYEGGELVIDVDGTERRVEARAGDVILYPSSYLHRVEEVTRGRRLVAVGWVQSLVRDPARRKLLFDLTEATDLLAAMHGETDEVQRIRRSHHNLLRMWADD